MIKYILIALIVIGTIAQVFWADWIVKEIYNKDINNWIILGSLLLLALATPKALNGVFFLAMAASTIYIWVLM
jgi:hypothetical protein